MTDHDDEARQLARVRSELVEFVLREVAEGLAQDQNFTRAAEVALADNVMAMLDLRLKASMPDANAIAMQIAQAVQERVNFAAFGAGGTQPATAMVEVGTADTQAAVADDDIRDTADILADPAGKPRNYLILLLIAAALLLVISNAVTWVVATARSAKSTAAATSFWPGQGTKKASLSAVEMRFTRTR